MGKKLAYLDCTPPLGRRPARAAWSAGWGAALLATTAITPLPAFAQSAPVLPQSGSFFAGAGTIATAGSRLTVEQSSQRGIVDWSSFSIGAGGTVRFENGAGATLNRVTGGDASSIFGTLSASGSVYLINPHGVVIGNTGVVTTGGDFVASTLDVDPDAFVTGGDLTFQGASTAQVRNLGSISSTGGDIYLIAHSVRNDGSISAPAGNAGLAAGSEVLLTEGQAAGGRRVFVTAGTGAVETGNAIEAAQVELAAADGNIYALAGDNGGIVRATGTETRNGRVWLTAGSGSVVHSGSMEARDADGSGGGVTVASGGMVMNTGTIAADGTSGGSVSVAGDRVINQGTVSATGSSGPGGSVAVAYIRHYVDTRDAVTRVDGTPGGSIVIEGTGTFFSSGTHSAEHGGSIDLFGGTMSLVGARIDVAGAARGGMVRIGGDSGGGGDAPHATSVLATATTSIVADAGAEGTGGSVVVWSNGGTEFAGSVSARGGTTSGDGGQVEIASAADLLFAGSVDARAVAGEAGRLVLRQSGAVIGEAEIDPDYLPRYELVDPTPNGYVYDPPNPAYSDEPGRYLGFGHIVAALDAGTVIVTDPADDTGAEAAGAAYLYDGASGALISMLVGTHSGDWVGDTEPAILAHGNYVLRSPKWNASAGAVTWGSREHGVAGVVSASNSLIGSTGIDPADIGSGAEHADEVGKSPIVALTNGNYVVPTPLWHDGDLAYVGAATWGDGSTGVSGTISAANSLVGTNGWEYVGSQVVALANGNYVVSSPDWQLDTGAVTWGDGTSGTVGTISAVNSLVGGTRGDRVGSVTALASGNYVVATPRWDDGANRDVGAATWGDGTTGIIGTVSAANSLVGNSPNDMIGSDGILALANGNYLVISTRWSNGAAAAAGAVTWGDGASGIVGSISAANSLVGTHAHDRVGGDPEGRRIAELTNGNYVVASPDWNGGMGAVTWGDGTGGTTGGVSAGNSLVGAAEGDHVGGRRITRITALTNGNYVVASPQWNLGAGAVTWGDGTGGTIGVVSAANSLVGTITGDGSLSSGDRIGIGQVGALSNGNYITTSPYWNDNAGAATWGNGTGGTVGAVSATNSLVGSPGDSVSNHGILMLADGNYVIHSPHWNGQRGAATWGDGTAGISGTISSTNSLVGSAPGDHVGGNAQLVNVRQTNGIALSNGNYVVASPDWDNDADNSDADRLGAATWGDGTRGVTGIVSVANSLIGSSDTDYVALEIGVHERDEQGLFALTNGNYVVSSTWWHNGATPKAGAVTWGDGEGGAAGPVSAINSLVGSTEGALMRYRGTTVHGRILAASPTDGGTGRVWVGAPDLARQVPHAVLPRAALTAMAERGTTVVVQAGGEIVETIPVPPPEPPTPPTPPTPPVPPVEERPPAAVDHADVVGSGLAETAPVPRAGAQATDAIATLVPAPRSVGGSPPPTGGAILETAINAGGLRVVYRQPVHPATDAPGDGPLILGSSFTEAVEENPESTRIESTDENVRSRRNDE